MRLTMRLSIFSITTHAPVTIIIVYETNTILTRPNELSSWADFKFFYEVIELFNCVNTYILKFHFSLNESNIDAKYLYNLKVNLLLLVFLSVEFKYTDSKIIFVQKELPCIVQFGSIEKLRL